MIGRMSYKLAAELARSRKLSRAMLTTSLAAYLHLHRVVNGLAVIHYGRSPKLAFDWGMAGFFVPRIETGASVLDIGCGRGHLTELLLSRASTVVAYDRDFSSIVDLRRRVRDGRLLSYCADAVGGMPMRTFDIAVLSSILPFVEDPQDLLRKLHGTAKRLLVRETRYDRDFTVLLARSLGLDTRADSAVRREFTRSELITELKVAGWTAIDVWDSFDIFIDARPS